jgi:basic membrane protein A
MTLKEVKMRTSSTWLRLFAVLVLAALLVVGCGAPAAETPAEEPAAEQPAAEEPAAEEPAAEEPAAEEAPLKVALVLPGSIADQGYNAAAYAGLQTIEAEFGAEIAYAEMVPIAEYEETFRNYAAEGYDIVIGHGFEFGDPIEIVAPEYPDTAFLVVNGIVSGDNYASLLHQNHQTAFVCGYIAARMSQTGKLGAIGGFAYSVIVQQLEAYRLGAEYVNSDIEVNIAYLDSWDDSALGKEAARAQISAGADCIFHVADAAGLGVIQACDEEGVWAIGFTYDQNELAPDTVITSTIIDYGEMLAQAVSQIVDGTFEFNTVHPYGLETGVIAVAPYHGLVPDDIAAEAEEIQQKIISGEIEVPLINEPTQ